MTPPPTALAPPGPPSLGAAPVRADGVELLGTLTGSGYRRAPGLVRRADGQTVQLTPLLYALLDLLDGRRDTGELAQALGSRVERLVTASDVDALLDRLRPLGVLAGVDGAQPAVRKAAPLLGLRLKVVVTDPERTRALTAPFAALFRPWVVLPVLAAFAVTVWWVLVERGLAAATHEAFHSPGLLLVVFVLTVLSAGFHEFGHAAACRYGGATPGAMGAGLYLVWPAFYTDVDDSYRLSRWGRLRVDLGGLYFNAVVAVAMAGLGLLTGSDALLLVVATQLLQMVRQLAPFIRADGYHLLADLTGVPDLFAHIGPTLKGLLPTRWGRPEGRVLRPWARAVVTAWVLVMVPVLLGLLGLMVWLLPRLAATAWSGLTAQSGLLAHELATGDVVLASARLLALLALVVPVLAITYLLVRVVRSTTAAVLRATEDRPTARLTALLAAAFLGAVLAGAWWPDGQYRPVEAGAAGPPPAASPAVAPEPAPVVAAPAAEPEPVVAAPVRAAAPAREPAAGPGPTDAAPQPVRAAAAAPARPAPPVPRDRGWTFPFDPPAAAGAGDNRAYAVVTRDRAVSYDVATSFVVAPAGAPVRHLNEAWALASCVDCAAVAVAYQVVLIEGTSDPVVPQNTARALSWTCERCHTRALAVQTVASLTRPLHPGERAQLRATFARAEGLRGRMRSLPLSQVQAELAAVEAELLAQLERLGLLAGAARDVAADEAVPTDEPAQGEVPVAATDPDREPTEPADGTAQDDVPVAATDPDHEPTEPADGTAQDDVPVAATTPHPEPTGSADGTAQATTADPAPMTDPTDPPADSTPAGDTGEDTAREQDTALAAATPGDDGEPRTPAEDEQPLDDAARLEDEPGDDPAVAPS